MFVCDQALRLEKFFLLNSAEHEIADGHQYKIIKKFCFFFSGSDKPRMLFFSS